MTLKQLSPVLDHDPDIRRMLDAVRLGLSIELLDLPHEAKAAVIATIAASAKRPILVVSGRQDRSEELSQSVAEFLGPEISTRIWPGPEALPYDQMPIDTDSAAERSALLALLSRPDPSDLVLFASAAGTGQIVTPKSDLPERIRILHASDQVAISEIVSWCQSVGYELVPLVHRPGQIARRGGIVDLFPPGSAFPYRIDFFGDEVDTIKRFDAQNQRSLEAVDHLELLPTIDLPVWNLSAAAEMMRALDISTLRPEVATLWQRTLDRAGAGIIPDSLELFAPYLVDKPATLIDHLPASALIIVDDASAIESSSRQRKAHGSEARTAAERSGELPVGLLDPLQSSKPIYRRTGTRQAITFGSSEKWQVDRSIEFRGFSTASVFAGRLEDFTRSVAKLSADGWSIMIATDQHERITDLLESASVFPRRQTKTTTSNATLVPGTVDVLQSDLDGGWSNPELKLMLLTDLEIFGFRKRLRRSHRRHGSQTGLDIDSLNPEDYVVHVDHGIARFTGLTRITLADVEREYLELLFDKGDKLFVPVDQSHRVVRYSSGTVDPTLSKLGSGEWIRTKRRVRHAVREMAFELVNLYATRETVGGHAFPSSTSWDVELADSFPYTETIDQMQSIIDVEADMEKPLPMDRLICGDVGFGKTEVAIRAAFKAVNAGKQVAVLVPTTVLALQHLSTFQHRLAAFPVSIEMLSRLRSPAEQRATVERLREGTVDIVIGTHRLVQKDVKFQDLGLVVIDEEQRFGVRQKEFLKNLRQEVDVITMSATPIPRTLHASLVGIRDISTINTAPQERMPVRTFVTAKNDELLREVILREIDRGGQVFFVHNRVSSIERVAAKLEDLVPEATFGIGHGQMSEEVLEHIMVDFIDRKFDVLVCTTIIESGVDIQNANTIIIDNADTLGLTQLYQLRGRVGRGVHRAYAYLLHSPGKVLSGDAEARLDAIREATELGSGMKLAIRDMEIRGAGNILGAEQSGHIADVGYELYVRLLSQAVEELKLGEPIQEQRPVLLDLPLTALIPPDYIVDVELRLATYRRVASVTSEHHLRQLLSELIDRFGPIPDEVERLMALIELRISCERLGIESVVEREREIVIRPVDTSKFNQREIDNRFGHAVRLTPQTIRIRLTDLDESWSSAVSWFIDTIEEHQAVSHIPDLPALASSVS